MTRINLVLIAAILLILPSLASAQNVPLPMKGSTAYEASHVFTGGLKVSTICVTWHTQAARWLMLFDATAAPSNGSVTPEWCAPLSAATTPADQGLCFDWTFHPVLNQTGVTFVVSTNAAGCTSLTADGANDWFNAQVSQ